MSLISLIHEYILRARIAYYQWALEDMDPCHPDVPLILLHVYQLKQRLAAIQRRFA
ncbi:MAG: hypothetical protein RBT81_13385 [Gammaproteobacteria bacterium]|jgi:hypothetical protein|nr:hypothetical protein [Gammaproteobacteria bacterium]